MISLAGIDQTLAYARCGRAIELLSTSATQVARICVVGNATRTSSRLETSSHFSAWRLFGAVESIAEDRWTSKR